MNIEQGSEVSSAYINRESFEKKMQNELASVIRLEDAEIGVRKLIDQFKKIQVQSFELI